MPISLLEIRLSIMSNWDSSQSIIYSILCVGIKFRVAQSRCSYQLDRLAYIQYQLDLNVQRVIGTLKKNLNRSECKHPLIALGNTVYTNNKLNTILRFIKNFDASYSINFQRKVAWVFSSWKSSYGHVYKHKYVRSLVFFLLVVFPCASVK